MGMQFSPMYQPVSTKTIKADGDLNVSPYDVIGYDGNFDTVEADEFVGGVGNFTNLVNVSTQNLALDYEILEVSTTNSSPVQINGSSTVINDNLVGTVTFNLNPITYPDFVGLIKLRNPTSRPTLEYTMTINVKSTSYSTGVTILKNGSVVSNITIAANKASVTATIPIEYLDNPSLSIKFYNTGSGAVAVYVNTVTISSKTVYLTPRPN